MSKVCLCRGITEEQIVEAVKNGATSFEEVKEETGLVDFKEINLNQDNLIPIDIDTHIINYNERLNLPEHYHFDFRYLFVVDKISDVKIDESESSDFKWIDINELSNNSIFGKIVDKIKKII